MLTTFAKSHFSWANELPAGVTADHGLTVRRFPTVGARSRVTAARLELRVQRSERLTPAEEIAWVNGRFRVPELYLHLAMHADELDAIVLSPYLFWSTIYGAQVAPDRTIVMPCLHDEPYARLGIVRSTFVIEPPDMVGPLAQVLPPDLAHVI